MRRFIQRIAIVSVATVFTLVPSDDQKSVHATCKKCPKSTFRSHVPVAIPQAAWGVGGGWMASAPATARPGYGYWPPGGYEGRIGSPYYYSASQDYSASFGDGAFSYGWSPTSADPYPYHFGPGFHRHSDFGHYRFPYYSYRRPWYFPGPPSWNRDTNFAW